MNRLITKSLETGDTSLLATIPKELLTDFEQNLVDWIREYTIRYGVTPSVDRLEKTFDWFVASPSMDPLRDLFDQEVAKRKSIYVKQFLMDKEDEIEKDPTESINFLARILNSTQAPIETFRNFDRSLYYRGHKMYQYGIPQIDKVTGGLASGDLVYIVGRPESNKTTIATWLASRWAISGLRILFISNENPAFDVLAKIDAFIGGWNPLNKRRMDWSDRDRRKVMTVSHVAANSEGDVVVPTEAVPNPDLIIPYVQANDPHIIIIDGAYLMTTKVSRSASGWETSAAVSRALKQIALRTDTPVIGILQASRKAEGRNVKREAVAYTDAYVQDADILLALNRQPEGYLFGELIKNRWGSLTGFMADIDFESMKVTIFRSLVEEDSEW